MISPDGPQTTAIGLLIRYLEGEGVRHVFGIPGGPLMPFYEALFERGSIQPILAKHEQGAAFMADGYARVRRGLGVCCTTTGPGGTNALTGIGCASADSIPLFILTAQIATSAFGKGAAQESTHFGVDLVELYKAVTKMSLMLINPQCMAETVRYLLRMALSGRPGPVHINIPADLMKKSVPLDLVQPERYRVRSESFDRASVQQAAKLLVRARRPAMLVGHGAVISGAFDPIRRLAERLVIPVATTPKAKGAFPDDHVLSLGIFGFAGSPQSEAYIFSEETDVLISIGTSLGELATHTWNPKFMPKEFHIQIDADPHEIGKNYPVQLPMIGDAKTVVTELLFHVEREARWLHQDPKPRRSVEWVRQFKAAHPRMIDPQSLEDEALPLKPQRLMYELRQAMPRDAILFVDIGNCMAWALHYFPVYEPGTFHINLGLASMGHAVAAAVGGQLAAPNKIVVALVGDAAFAMSGMEVHTAVEYNLPVIWLVLNNGGHGMVHHGEKLQFKDKFSTSKFRRRLDVAAMAEAMGAAAHKVERPNELLQAMALAVKERRPTVIDARIDIDAVPPMALRIETLDRFFESGAAVPASPVQDQHPAPIAPIVEAR